MAVTYGVSGTATDSGVAVPVTDGIGGTTTNGGADVPVLSKLSVRIEIRGLAYKTPDFGIVAFQTKTFSFVYEPSLGVAYRF